MNRYLLSIVTCIVGNLYFGSPAISETSIKTNTPVYFSQDWCPSSDDIDTLSKHYKLTMSGCCVFKAERNSIERVASEQSIALFKDHIVSQQDIGNCMNATPEMQSKRRQETQAVELANVRAMDVETRELPMRLRSLDENYLCSAAGNLVRGQPGLQEAAILKEKALPYVAAELKRRRTVLNVVRVKAENIRIGDTECQLYAAWGTPQHSNRTVTRNAVYIQHVYGMRTYVYTENGRIRSWQD